MFLLNPWFVRVFFSLITLECFADLGAGKTFIHESVFSWTSEIWLTRVADLARYTFFIKDKTPSSASLTSNDFDISWLDGIVTLGTALGLLQR